MKRQTTSLRNKKPMEKLTSNCPMIISHMDIVISTFF